MKKNFKYDYNNKVTILGIIVSLLFVVLAIIAYKDILGFIILILIAVIILLNTLFNIIPQGLHFNTKINQLVIVDEVFYRRFDINNIQYLSYQEVKKKVRKSIYGFFTEYYHPATYMSECDYVYNNGKVFIIKIYLKKGGIYQTYFGWMYKEKSKKRVMKKEEELKAFIDEINLYLKQKNKW